ncbi:hypothetical protein K7X08_025219 [Anisodus acutangulus]|uniref:Uncharacterized protein n=1 Tax=Anisodus acutangulus TaxID=402998 RepID=A0A9Q1RDN3_9SOLA|nr:hypothetical protein K7X08_025219 [Anisodus acutangulus]
MPKPKLFPSDSIETQTNDLKSEPVTTLLCCALICSFLISRYPVESIREGRIDTKTEPAYTPPARGDMAEKISPKSSVQDHVR